MPENGLFVVGSALWPWGLGGTFSLEKYLVNRILTDPRTYSLDINLVSRILTDPSICLKLPGIFAISVAPAVQGNHFVFAYAGLR